MVFVRDIYKTRQVDKRLLEDKYVLPKTKSSEIFFSFTLFLHEIKRKNTLILHNLREILIGAETVLKSK